MTSPVHVLIVEDHPLYRVALMHALEQLQCGSDNGLRFSAAASQADALALLASWPDILLVVSDQGLRQGNGLDLLQEVGQRWPTVARVLMSGTNEPGLVERARRMGLMGFLPKALEPRQLVQAIDQVLSGEPWFPPLAKGSDAPLSQLTERQQHVLAGVAAGQSNKQVARALGLSERTVKFHLECAYLRLGVANRAEAVVRALRQGLIRIPVAGTADTR
jgi:DNA-binding NarL/FixJ family response regulator